MKNNISIATEAVKLNIHSFHFIDNNLINNLDFMLSLFTYDNKILNLNSCTFASKSLKNNYNYMIVAVGHNGDMLAHASPRLRKCDDIILKAYYNNKESIRFANKISIRSLFKNKNNMDRTMRIINRNIIKQN